MVFEGSIMAYNVAYAFEKTPFYRPWLSWAGVDLRRMSVEDLVNISTHLSSRFAESDCEARSSSSNRQGKAIGKSWRANTPTCPRLAQNPTPNCHIFHQISRVVVLSVVASSRHFDVTSWTGGATASLTPTTSKRITDRIDKIWILWIMRLRDHKCNGAAIWVCVLLQVCVQPCRETREVSCYIFTCTYMGFTEGACMRE
jgi:hypothetical protein